MSVIRSITIKCDHCKAAKFYGPSQVWVEGPVRSEAGHAGWKCRSGKDYCDECVKELNMK